VPSEEDRTNPWDADEEGLPDELTADAGKRRRSGKF
jgi:hypothetical protein